MKNLNLKRLFVPFAAGILLCACGANSANSSANSGAVNSSVNSAKKGVANSKENNSSGENNSSCGCNDFGSQEQINKFFGIDSKK